MEGRDKGAVELQEWLATGADYVGCAALPTRPECGDTRRQCLGGGELAAIRSCADKIGVTKSTRCGGTVLLAATPQIAAGKTAEYSRSPRVLSFTLKGVEQLFDGVGHAAPRQTSAPSRSF